MNNFGTRALLVCMLACASLRAEPITIPVVGKGWQITFEGPVLAMEGVESDAQGLAYRANAGRFNVSAFVEPPSGGGVGNKACRDFYWAQASRNPMIQKDSIKQWGTPACECVEYLIEGDLKGEKFKQANINCYFVHEGKWVDVHASIIEPGEGDGAVMQDLAKSLAYGAFPEVKPGSRQFVLGNLGQVKIELPAGWRVGNRCVVKNDDLPDQHTLSFYSATDLNKNWKMTFFKSPTLYKTLKDVEQAARDAQQTAIDASVEKAANLREIKLKQGVGCQAVYTDAELAGKPVEPGNAKVISSGFVSPVPTLLGTVTIFADDVKDADFLAAIQALGTIEWVAGKE